MQSSNYIIYQVFSALNIVGCILAVICLYRAFPPRLKFHKATQSTALGLGAICMYGVITQANTLIVGDLNLAWQPKLLLTIIIITSLRFARKAAQIDKEITHEGL